MEEKLESFDLSDPKNERHTFYFAKRKKEIPGADNPEYAVKKLDFSPDELVYAEEIKSAMNSYKFIKSPFISKPQFYAQGKGPVPGGLSVYLFMERMQTSLEDQIYEKQRKRIPFSAEEMKNLVRCIMGGFEVLQDKKMLHSKENRICIR
jgi:hypothetical protein